jgi:FKBP-type peptidyl-prolyl cis-trans isomerase FkpA
MLKAVLFVLFGSLVFVSCLKKDSGCSYGSDSNVAPVSEQAQLKSYLDSAGISATLNSNGFYYQIISQGAGAVPGPCSQVTVAYKGWLTNGAIFDQSSSSVFTLGGLIDGWREGLPLIKKGGEVKLYIPPSLGYGPASNPPITAYSILIFDISLLDVQ